MAFQTPAFIAFTGVDRLEIKKEMIALSAQYPIEWGILVDDARPHNALFPSAAMRAELLSGGSLRWAAHICGDQAKQIANATQSTSIALAGIQRVQINHSFSGSNEAHIVNSCTFGRRHGVRTVLQCSSSFPHDLRVDWLFDTSFGKGSSPQAWPPLPVSGPFCGLSGGLNPDNVRQRLEIMAAPAGTTYWIDMESGIRTDGWLDMEKCAAVCRAVYG